VIPALIFAATYVVLATGRARPLRLDRPGAAVVGAILMVVFGAVSLDDAWRAIDSRTILLLFGMMIVVASLWLARFFMIVARAAAGTATHPAALLAAVVLTSGVLSGVFVNDAVCLALTPVLIRRQTSAVSRPSRATRRTC
jgi:Na+/H+ antiporter NhaD/arsenite permease-like protein